MLFLTVRALVLSSSPHRDSDRIVRLLTREHGMITCTASGAAKSGSRFSFGTQPGILSDYVLNKSRDFWYVKELEVVESFRVVQEDLYYLTAAAHLLEIARDACVDMQTSGEILVLLLHAFQAMNAKRKNYRLVVCAAEWRMMNILGFPADFSAWEDDGGGSSVAVFSYASCRLLGKGRGDSDGASSQSLSRSAVEALLYIRGASLESLFSFEVNPDVLNEISCLSRRYLCDRLERRYDKMDMLVFSDEPWG